MPQSPRFTSSTMHHVTWLIGTPSIDIIASVSFCTIACFYAAENTPAMILT